MKKAVVEYRSNFEDRHPGAQSKAALVALLFYLGVLHLDEVPDLSRMNDLFHLTVSMMPDSIESEFSNLDGEIFQDCLNEIEKIGALCRRYPAVERATFLGDLYQMWGTACRKKALSSIQSADKAISEKELISFTKIYTPDWVVDFLTKRAFMRGRRNDKPLQEFKVIDPACGSGHFYFGALNYLLDAYKAEKRNSREALEHILNNQLVALDIDKNALFIVALITALTLRKANIKSGIKLKNIIHIDLEESNMLGSLNKELPDRYKLNTRYDVVLTNPPYIGRKLIDRQLKSRLKEFYPEACFDLSSAFIRRCLELLDQKGKFGIITQASFLSLPTFKKLRQYTINNYRIDSIVDLGPGVFPTQSGEKINSALMVFEKPEVVAEAEKITFIDLRESKDKQKSLRNVLSVIAESPAGEAPCAFQSEAGETPALPGSIKTPPGVYHVSGKTIRNLYNYAFNYQIPEELTECFSKLDKLEEVAMVKQGLATTDNQKFVKYIWQTEREELNKIWYPYAKGAGESKWYSPVIHVVDWQDNGKRIKNSVQKKYPYLKGKVNWVVKNEDYYFKPGLSFSFVSSKGMKVRTLPGNCIFDVGASAVFPKEETDRYFLLGYLNSSLINAFMSCINPTINNQVGDLKRIPYLDASVEKKESIRDLARTCCETTRKLFELTSSVSIYLSTIDPTDNTASFPELLKVMPNSLSESESLYRKKIWELKSKLAKSESDLNKLVIELYADRFSLNPRQVKAVTTWADQFNQKNAYNNKQELGRNQFINMIITSKILACANHFEKQDLESHLDRSLIDYIKTDYQSFIGRSFKGALPSNLLLNDIEEKIIRA